MPDQRPVVKTIGLTKVFKDFWLRNKVVAVQNLDLEVRPGEVFGLLGPNGSGKSTTIKMLLGLLYPTRGRISIFGRPPTDVAVKSRIGYLPEESYLYRFLNARETLQLYAKLFQQVKQVRGSRIDKLLEMVGLQHQAKRRIGEYSKGMARRIGLAQALINDPDFLLLDEPTTGLDPIGTQQIKELIRELGRRGKTILLSSHLLSDVQDVCDRVCILYGGQVRALGEIDELLRQEKRTQITSSSLKEETISEIKTLIMKLERKDDVVVSSPTERLESFFVRIVEEAQAASVATSGVQAGGALPDFLSEPEGGMLIESLVSAAATSTQDDREESEKPQPVAGETESVLDELLEDQTRRRQTLGADREERAASKERHAEPVRPAKPQEQVDRDLIDSLTNAAEDEERE